MPFGIFAVPLPCPAECGTAGGPEVLRLCTISQDRMHVVFLLLQQWPHNSGQWILVNSESTIVMLQFLAIKPDFDPCFSINFLLDMPYH